MQKFVREAEKKDNLRQNIRKIIFKGYLPLYSFSGRYEKLLKDLYCYYLERAPYVAITKKKPPMFKAYKLPNKAKISVRLNFTFIKCRTLNSRKIQILIFAIRTERERGSKNYQIRPPVESACFSYT